MIVIPSVDIKSGKCVRLVEGREGTETVFDEDPAAAAERWISQGAEYLHVVDLDGAFGGVPRNFEKVVEIIDNSPVGVEFGGGVRETSVVNGLIEAGADRQFSFCGSRGAIVAMTASAKRRSGALGWTKPGMYAIWCAKATRRCILTATAKPALHRCPT